MKTPKWHHMPTTKTGDFMFFGRMHLCGSICKKMTSSEILNIRRQLIRKSRKRRGLSRLQVFMNTRGQKIICVDMIGLQLRRSGKLSLREIYQRSGWYMVWSDREHSNH